MKPLVSTIALATSLVLASAGAYAQNTTSTQTPPAPPGTAGQMNPDTRAHTEQVGTERNARQSALVKEDRTFLENAIQGSHAEIEGSQLALEKGQANDVKAFAKMMIKDHGMMLKEAQALASKKGVTPPTGPSAMQVAEITGLKALSGGAFDAMYVNRIGVAAHESTVEMFEKASQDAQDPDVKAMATKALPKLREHLKAARDLNEKQDKR